MPSACPPAWPTERAPRQRPRALRTASLLLVVLAVVGLVGATTRTARAAEPVVVPLTVVDGAASSETATVEADGTDHAAADQEMTAWKAVVLGVVEGVTEYLPVSSTGHLLVTQRILGIGDTSATKDAADSYAIAIQFGAILAVLVLYRRRIASIIQGLLGRDSGGRRLLIALACATLPAVVIGLAFEKPIKDHLLGPWPVTFAWLVGGLVLLWVAPRSVPIVPASPSPT